LVGIKGGTFNQKEGVVMPEKEKVEEVLDKIRPSLVADGGGVELVNINGGTVEVRLTGACDG